MFKALTLTASRVAHAAAGFATPALTASAPARTLAGIVVPFGVAGSTSIGPVIVPGPEAITLPADLSRVKLVDYHQSPPVSIGYATSAEVTAEGIRMAFTVARTPDGDRALLEAVEGARDAFSVELSDLVFGPDGKTLRSSTMTATALVVVPAYADARVDSVAASHHPTEGSNTMLTDEQRARLEALRAQDTRTEAEEAEFSALATLAGEAPAAPAAPAATVQVTEPAPAAGPADMAPALAAALGRAFGLAGVPEALSTNVRQTSDRPVTDLYAAMSRVARGESRPELEAALSNITNTANLWVRQDEYAGQLWDGSDFTRRWVDLTDNSKPLTSYKGTGWRWVVKPVVADYAGDKAAVPSNAPTTEAVPWTAARLAGAHDFDRAYIDFGDTEFVASYYEAMTESYKVQTDAKAHAAVLAGVGTTVAGGAIKLMEAIAVGVLSLDNTVHQEPDYIVLADADWLDLLGITNNNLPAYLEMLGVDPSKFKHSPDLAAGTVLLGVKKAVAFRELGSTPIRVETVDLVNGGVDGGVFGYYTSYETHDGGRVKVTFTGGVV